MWNLKQNKQTKQKLTDTENRLMAARRVGWGDGHNGLKKYKLPVIK